MGSHLLEIVNKNIDFQKNYIEFELLDTNFSNFAKYISPNIITFENEKNGEELSAIALTEWYNEQIETDARLTAYENEISAYAATISMTVIFEKLDYPENFKEKIAAEQIANYEVLKFLIDRELDIRKRMIIIRKVLGDMAMLGKIKSIDEIVASITNTTDKNFKLLAIHPSLKIAVFSCFQSYGLAYGGQGGDTYYWSGFKIQARHLNSDFTVGEVIAERIVYSDNGQGTTIPASEFEFSSLGDVARLTASRNDSSFNTSIDEIVDFSEYGLALSPNWQGITLDVIEGRA